MGPPLESLTSNLVPRFEQHLAEAVGSLLTLSQRVPGNPEGYALFRAGPVRATLSPADLLQRFVELFNSHGVPARMRIAPVAFTHDQADHIQVATAANPTRSSPRKTSHSPRFTFGPIGASCGPPPESARRAGPPSHSR
jgi:hypothetical protein